MRVLITLCGLLLTGVVFVGTLFALQANATFSFDGDARQSTGPIAAIRPIGPLVSTRLPCDFACPGASVSGCTLEKVVAKFGPPQKLYVEVINHGTVERLMLSRHVQLLYPSKGFNLDVGGTGDTYAQLRPETMVTDYSCYAPVTLDEYIFENAPTRWSRASEYAEFEDWVGFSIINRH
jgi:hypothetical protein